MNQRNKLPLLVVPLLLAVSCHSIPRETISDIEISFDGIEKVRVSGGALEISYTGGAETDKVFLNAFVESTDPGMEGVRYRQSGNELIVEFETESHGSFLFGNPVEGFISLKGPRNVALDMYNSSGKMEVYHVKNESILLKASSGKVEGRDLESPNLRVQISSGRVELKDIRGNLDLELSSGMASLEGMKGDVQFQGSSGLVQLSDVEGKVAGKMSSGKADLKRIANLGEISLTSGMLQADNCGLGEDSFFSASSGYMKVSSNARLSDYNFDFKVGSGRLSIGDRSSSEDLYIDHGARQTIKGNVQSGRMVLEGS
jgi:hypothetical protein